MPAETLGQGEQTASFETEETRLRQEQENTRNQIVGIRPIAMQQGEAERLMRERGKPVEGTLDGHDIHPSLNGVRLNYKAFTDGEISVCTVNLDPSSISQEVTRKVPWAVYLVEKDEHVFKNVGEARNYFQNKAEGLARQSS